jgi:hypothetical protein
MIEFAIISGSAISTRRSLRCWQLGSHLTQSYNLRAIIERFHSWDQFGEYDAPGAKTGTSKAVQYCRATCAHKTDQSDVRYWPISAPFSTASLGFADALTSKGPY